MTALRCSELSAGERGWTAEQRAAIERREGDLLLAAGAGSGKTAVLVERFVRSVLEDGVDVSAILTITFTEKAAAEMRDRIRARLRELGAAEQARATEGAFISTIHGFCARVLRTHALLAGLDPAFSVLDEAQSRRLARAAFESVLEELALADAGVRELIASHGPAVLRVAIGETYVELRSRGELDPALPSIPETPEIEGPRERLLRAASELAVELGAAGAGARVLEALGRLGRCDEVAAAAAPWPGELDRLALPGGNGAALSTPACETYTTALGQFREVCAHRRALEVHAPLNLLLRAFAARYEQAKRAGSGLDFEDLELLTRDLLLGNDELRQRYQARFARIMVDELQDTNPVQLELIESLASENLFMVGDSQQSIYGFRGADVELFERRAEQLDRAGALARLQTNFRSRPEILEVINQVFASAEQSEPFVPLIAGRQDPPSPAPAVELLLVDKTAEWAEDESLASPWRLAEARLLAGRVSELLAEGVRAGDVVVLARAATDLRLYERALEDRGVPTYLIGGRGYWSHPQVIDLVAYLRALANPRDEEALYSVLAGPIVGVSADALVVLAARAREAKRDPWWVLHEPAGPVGGDQRPLLEGQRPQPLLEEQRRQPMLEELTGTDSQRLARFTEWFAAERARAQRHGIDELIDRAIELSGYDLAILAMPGGRRRLANIRKLMRLAREYELTAGRDLRGFLDQVAGGEGPGADPKESEAPVEGEALDAVRLMTIHRSKGLEFDTVCLADLGRGPRYMAELIRIGRDGRFGVRLAQAGSGRREPALDYQALRQERIEEQRREERRLMYVAMTRARERLILSGAARLDRWPEGNGGTPIGWLGPALLPELEPTASVGLTLVQDPGVLAPTTDMRELERPGPGIGTATLDAEPPGSSVTALSYSALGQYRRCGYRFYAERVLGLPTRLERPATGAARRGAPGERGRPGELAGRRPDDWSPAERGVVIHDLLERLDFRRPLPPTEVAIAEACERAGLPAAGEAQAGELTTVVEAFAGSALCERLGRATQVRREQRFGFLLGREEVLVTGALDVLAREGDGMLVVDYKSDRLEALTPTEIVAGEYATQRLIYAVAVLRSGAEAVDVVHVFLERPDAPVNVRFTSADLPALELELDRLTERVVRGEFPVTDTPHRAICDGCPAEGGLCSWPLEMTRRDAPDTLF